MIKKEALTRRAQVTIFVIVAIVIVLMIVLFFMYKDYLFQDNIPKNMRPVYDSYLDCLEDISTEGVYILGQQGGHIDVPEFVPGSAYRPFSSHLDFFGQPVPYWMYVSGNNILEEQVPTKGEMKLELEKYIKDRVDLCSFQEYEVQGYGVMIERGDVEVNIKDSSVEVLARNPVTIYFENDSVRVNQHKVEVDIRLGKLYDQAKELYNYEKTDMFLEKYTIDVMRLYTPVDGVELQCTPIVFNDFEIRKNLTQGLVSNINFLKVKGSYYELSRKESEYFVVDPGFKTDTQVNFIYDPSWPTRVEVYGEKTAKPVGLQEGLSMLGFCYVPYHLVYDINYPVLIQFWEGDFFFQFPVSVIIEKNYAREALPPMEGGGEISSEVCKFKNQRMRIYTYDSQLNPLPARLQFKCLNSQCELGESKMVAGNAIYDGQVPECLNGFIVATAPGYAETKYQVSTNVDTAADVLLAKKYKIGMDLGNIGGNAVVTFSGEKYTTTVLYPETREVELIEDLYNISVYVYKETSLKLQGYDDKKCVDAPVDGVGSLFGLTQEKCFDINIPEMEIDSALIGGGKTEDYFTEDQLRRSRQINLNVPKFFEPNKIEDIQANYILLEESPVYISFN